MCTDEAFKYWMPALAQLTLGPDDDYFGWYGDSLLSQLERDGPRNSAGTRTVGQRDAVDALLEHLRDAPECADYDLLDRFWSRVWSINRAERRLSGERAGQTPRVSLAYGGLVDRADRPSVQRCRRYPASRVARPPTGGPWRSAQLSGLGTGSLRVSRGSDSVAALARVGDVHDNRFHRAAGKERTRLRSRYRVFLHVHFPGWDEDEVAGRRVDHVLQLVAEAEAGCGH